VTCKKEKNIFEPVRDVLKINSGRLVQGLTMGDCYVQNETQNNSEIFLKMFLTNAEVIGY